MSKIAEKKALEEYPKINHLYSTDVEREIDAKRAYYRTAYIVGYDQAMQDFLEKSEKFFNKELFTRFNGAEHRVASNKCMNLQQFTEQFKNYMQDESKN